MDGTESHAATAGQARGLQLTMEARGRLGLRFCSRDTLTSGFLMQIAVRPCGVRSSCRDKCHRLDGLEKQGRHCSQFWKLQVQDGGAGGGSPTGHRPLTVSSPGGRGRELWGPLFKGMSPIQEAAPPSRPNHPPPRPHFLTLHLGGEASNTWIWGDTRSGRSVVTDSLREQLS